MDDIAVYPWESDDAFGVWDGPAAVSEDVDADHDVVKEK